MTTVRREPGGPVVAVVDGDAIRPYAGGERQLFVDGADIRPEPGAERRLFADGVDVRPEPGGHRLAFWDGATLRRAPGGRILLVVDGDDVRTDSGGERLYFLDGGAPDLVHLTALLYYLRPSVFTLSPEEAAAAKEAVGEGQAWNEAQESPENEEGTYEPVTANGPIKGAGALTVAWRKDHYALAFAGRGIRGAALKRSDGGYRMTGGLATGEATYGLFVHRDGAYHGIWLGDPQVAPTATDSFACRPKALASVETAIGRLRFTENGSVAGNGSFFDVAADGRRGVALVAGNDAVGCCLAVVLGPGATVMDARIDGGTLEAEYQAAAGEDRYFNVSR